ncbi:putative lipid II flippase FtsW, partial [Mycobacterium tuberculosis]
AQTQPARKTPRTAPGQPARQMGLPPRPGSPRTADPPVRRSVHHGAGQRYAGQRRTRRVRALEGQRYG